MTQASPPRAIAFLHIPKTAGTSVRRAFEIALGEAACRQMAPAITDEDFQAHQFISGHQILNAITANAWRFTFLREPVAQVASHLRWLDHYNELPYRAETHAMSSEMRHIVVRVGQTDFDSAAAIDALFDWLPENSPARLGNVQCEVLSRRPGRATFSDPAELAAAAIFNLRLLNFVGLTEYVERDMVRLFRRLGITTTPELGRHNSLSSARHFDLRDAAVRGALEKRMQADMRLYEHVLRRQRAIVIPW